MVQPGQIKVHFKDGNTSVYPELNKNNIVRLMSADILRIEHYKPIFTEPKKRGRPKK
tara:strand:- start:337 stop:507 length:171 start_codon:yes stop_codon:yes gene_type:complete